MRCSDRIIQRGAAKLGIRVIHVRKATLTKPRDERPSCHYCGNCMAGCDVVAKYDSANVQMFPAQSTGKLTILSDSVVSDVTLGRPDARQRRALPEPNDTKRGTYPS